MLIVLAALVALALLLGRGGALDGTRADGQVQVDLAVGTPTKVARQEVTSMVTRQWQATLVGEDSVSDSDEVRLVFSLPGADLNAALRGLRDYEHAETVHTVYEVDVDQLAATPLASGGPGTPAEPPRPVRLEVVLQAHSDTGPWLFVVGVVVVLLAGFVALWLHRRWTADDRAVMS